MLLHRRIKQHWIVDDMLTLHFNIVDSTNVIAKQLLASHDECMITADQQTHGKGRNGKTWNAGLGKDIIFTHAKNVRKTAEYEPLMMQACAALAVQAFLLDILPKDAIIKIKYPNDVYVKYGDKMGKISGSLIETEYSGSTLLSIITGIGINVNSESKSLGITQPIVSVYDILQQESNLHLLRRIFSDLFLSILNDKASILNRWKAELDLIEKTILIPSEECEYRVINILEDGRLLCSDGHTERMIHSGDSIRYQLFD